MSAKVRQGKGGKERVLPLSNRLLKELGPTGGRSVKIKGT
jgi:hypothetical protein